MKDGLSSYRYRPVRFFLAANFITWSAWLTAAYLSYSQSDLAKILFPVFEVAGLFGPFAAAMWMIFSSGFSEIKSDFYNRLLNIKLIIPASIPAIFLIMPAAVIISVFLSHQFFGQSLGQLKIADMASKAVGIVPLPVMFFGAALLEELGWKGYGMDSLRGKRTFFTATLIYSFIWIFWHLPLFFINNYYHNTLIKTDPLLALNFIASVIPTAFIINWLWYKNGRSILAAVLFHATANLQGLLQMSQTAKCIETAVLSIFALTIVMLDKDTFFKDFG